MGNGEKCFSQRPKESDLAGNCEKCLSQVNCHPISSIFYIWTAFSELLFMSEYGFCPTNSNHNFSLTARNFFFTSGYYAGPVLV